MNEAKAVNLTNEDEFRKTYDKKLNKNTCDSIDTMLENLKENMAIQLNVKWNEEKEIQGQPPTIAEVTQDDEPRFETMSTYLTKIPEEVETKIVGKIIRIDIPKEEPNKVTITIDDQRLRKKVSMTMSGQDFRKSFKFAEEGKFVSVEGILTQSGNRWSLKTHRNFQIQTDLNDIE